MISVIVPFSRPERFAEVHRQLCEQTLPPKIVVFVRNGRALKQSILTPECFPISLRSVSIGSDDGVPQAMNAGLRFLRMMTDGPWAKWDDDDEYGVGYLAELYRAMLIRPEANVFGKRFHHVRMNAGVYLFNPWVTDPHETMSLAGPTLSCRTTDCPGFPEHLRRGSDWAWLERCKERGWRGWSTGADNFVHDRTGTGHVWQGTEMQYRTTLGESIAPDGSTVPVPTNEQLLAEL